MDGVAIGDAVEDLVLSCYDDKKCYTIDTQNMRKDRHGTYHRRTRKIMESAQWIISQPAFVWEDIFVKCDFLLSNDDGLFDLIEVKAKNTIRKKTKEAPLLDQLIADVSIQAYVLKRVLKEKFSWKVQIAHLNKSYKKDGLIDPKALVLKEDVTTELMTDEQIESCLQQMREKLVLKEKDFNQAFPYDGTDHMIYFWFPAPKKSIWSIPRLSSQKKKELYEQWRTLVEHFSMFDIDFFTNKKGEESTASQWMQKYQLWKKIVDKDALKQELAKLSYPLYFYDYETVSGPVPEIEQTVPWQQCVVQYSMHKLDESGKIHHYEWLIDPAAEKSDKLLQSFIHDTNEGRDGTFIVWNKCFENKRNEERWGLYHQYKEALWNINKRTYDLMDIFKQLIYFHQDFEWSSSIKKVLPVVTDVSYEGLAIANGWLASKVLMKRLKKEIPEAKREKAREKLLEYCKMDTRAMLIIRKELVKEIGL